MIQIYSPRLEPRFILLAPGRHSRRQPDLSLRSRPCFFGNFPASFRWWPASRAILFALALTWFPGSFLAAQEPLQIDTTRRSLYSGVNFGTELYRFTRDETVEQMVEAICSAADRTRNFQVINANVPNVAAVWSGNTGYLLYNRRYFYENRSNRTLLITILAHEIGHLLLDHQLNGRFRIREETGADEFAGQTLMRLDSLSGLEKVLGIIRAVPFSYPQVPWPEREIALERGWKRAAALMQGPGFGINAVNLEEVPLPRFQISGCPNRVALSPDQFSQCHTLGDVNATLCRALNARGYVQRGYFCVSGGFALVTAVEQFNPGGTSMGGEARWQDYPRRDNFTGILDYLYSVIFPEPARSRLFVFIVSDQAVLEYAPGCLNPADAPGWVRSGGDWLPDYLAIKNYDVQESPVRALVYEFKVPVSNLKMREECEPMPILTHLQQSGILAGIQCR